MTPNRLAWLAAGSTIAFAVAIWWMAGGTAGPPDDIGPPETKLRRLVTALLLATPGVIGVAGAVSRRRTLLVAAGILCLIQSVVAFSGVTLLFLVPGLAFLRAGARGAAARDDGRSRRGVRPGRLLLLMALAAPLSIVVVALAGVFGVLGLAVVAGVAATLADRDGGRPHIDRRDLVVAAAVVALGVGAWISSLALSGEVCWIASRAPDGSLTYRWIPVSNTISLRPNEVGGGCDSGVPTIEGLGVTAVLGIGAVGVGFLAGTDAPGPTRAATYHRRDDDPSEPDRPG